MLIGRYALNIRGCTIAIQEIQSRKREGYQKALKKQLMRGRHLLEQYDEVVSQRCNSTISMKWYHLIKEDATTLREVMEGSVILQKTLNLQDGEVLI